MNQFLFCFLLLNIFIVCINARQNYSGSSALGCDNNDESGSSSAFLYTCNGQDRNCQAFLIYKAQPPFNSVPSISALTSSNLGQVASINNVTEDAKFPTGKEVIIPVNCFCLGPYYQANTKFHISSIHGTYYTIGTEAYQGLATCSSLKRANPLSEYKLVPGTELKVPLRCACPTSYQTNSGTKYLVIYSLSFEDDIADISDRFNVRRKSINDANGLEDKQTIFPSTTILIPLPTEPSSSRTIIHKDQPRNSPPFEKYQKSCRSKRKLYEGVGIAATCFLLVLIIIILFTTFMFGKRKDGVLQSGKERKKNYVLPEDLRIEIARLDQGFRVFTFEEIKKATRNFSSKNRINGSVYRGGFGGKILAVKRMRPDVSKEVQLLKNINHFNLIKLQGVCENDGFFYLVFDYMKKGSLRDWLCNQSSDEIGSRTRRIQIALDVANGLHYLHSFTKPSYLHGDIKSTNVLLNGGLRAKIANFSLARAVANETSSVASTTTWVLGTRGYLAPEYVEIGQVTSKIDVFAFGVVLLELITGQEAIITQDRREILLSKTVVSTMEKESAEAELDSLIDPRLKCDNQTGFALQMAQLSVACLTEEPTKRPSMEEVVSVLSKIRADVCK